MNHTASNVFHFGFILVCIAMVLLACHDRKTAKPVPPTNAQPVERQPAPTTSGAAESQLTVLNQKLADNAREKSQLLADKKDLTAERDRLAEDESVKKIRSQTTLVSWLAGFGIFACVAAFFLFASSGIPWIRTLTLSGAGAAVAVLAIARVVSWLAPYLLMVGWCLTGAGVLGLLFYLWKSSQVNKAVVGMYEKAKPSLDGIMGKGKRLEMQAEAVGKHTSWISNLQKRLGINQ